jgi:hypothetical protein
VRRGPELDPRALLSVELAVAILCGLSRDRESDVIEPERCLDCESGRAMGCGTYCCQLLVRLTADEVERFFPRQPERRFLDKDDDGYCCFLDRASYRCDVWIDRPQVCREYDCNQDSLLQVALRHGFTSVVELVKRDGTTIIPVESYRYIGYHEDE